MRTFALMAALVVALGCPVFGHADDGVGTVKKAVGRSTLNQPGTRPFHLKAVLAPSRDSDEASNRTGEVEIWWASPTRWRREVRSPEFHQLEIESRDQDWQKNDGNYFPEWLREMATEQVDPVPPLEQVLKRVKTADVKRLMGHTYMSWTEVSANDAQESARGDVALTDSAGLLFYAGGLGWGGFFEDFQEFHGRMIARTVKAGTPEVTAKVTLLEDLGETPAAFFDVQTGDNGKDGQPIHTLAIDQTRLQKNLLPGGPAVWPAVQDGPLEGNVGTTIVVDRTGKIREMGR